MTTFLWILVAIIVIGIIAAIRRSNKSVDCNDCVIEDAPADLPEQPVEAPAKPKKAATKKTVKKTAKKGKK